MQPVCDRFKKFSGSYPELTGRGRHHGWISMGFLSEPIFSRLPELSTAVDNIVCNYFSRLFRRFHWIAV
jgi:hypothetical protein